ncbi:GNAT family N-acetyltransferase [Legionella sp. CNM-4043-24]|uniref:GNAT family N-acetyltransferase n=1 Tax=Legionella sp. CNM-4043-24 TaxID=3421646 RepID=UPI00403ACC36
MTISTRRVLSQDDLQRCLAIRNEVFVQEQQVPLDEEVDGKDRDSEHFLLYVNDQACGTARVRYVDEFAKIERVAILNAFRGQNLGRHLMNGILSDLARNTTYSKAKLSSQVHAIPFYEKLGFVVCGDEYMDAGIPHQDMIRPL